jgi:mono/diheme cytochrome c family protein
MMRRRSAILSILLSGTLAVAAASSSRWQHVPAKDHARSNPLADNSEAIAAGALVYGEHCLQCHKANAQGDGHKRPALRSERIRMASDGDIEWFLRQGDLGHGMPSWSSLPEAQRWQVVVYLRSIQ